MFFRHKIFCLFFFISLYTSITHGQNQHISVTSPSGGQSIMPGQTVQVMWTVRDSGGGGLTKISLVNSGTGYTRQISNIVDLTLLDVGVGSHTWSWSVDRNIPDGQGYTVNVQGSTYSDASNSFTIGNVVKTSAPSSSTPQRTSSSSSLIRSTSSSSNLNISSSMHSSLTTSSSMITSAIPSSSASTFSDSTNTTSANATSTDDSESSGDLSSFGKIGIVLGGILGLVVVSGAVMALFGKVRRNQRKKEDDSDAIPLAKTYEPQVLSPVPKFDPAPVYRPPQTYQQPRPPYGGRPPANTNYPHFGAPNGAPNGPPQPQRYAGGPQMMGRPPVGGPPMGGPPMGGPPYGRGF